MNWQEILRKVKYSTTVVVIDFETYFDKDYNLSKLSTVEYVCDGRFYLNSLGVFAMNQPFADSRNTHFAGGRVAIASYIRTLQRDYGKNLEGCTIVGQNLFFDSLVLAIHFGIVPKYSVDVLNLARFIDSRRKNGLEYLCKYYDVGYTKGDTKQFNGLKINSMTDEQVEALSLYNKTDVSAETELFRLLLPKLSNPEIELPLQRHTLDLFLKPTFDFDSALADKTIQEMQQELVKDLDAAKPLVNKHLSKDYPDVITLVRSNKIVNAIKEYLPSNEEFPTKVGKGGLIPQLAKTDEGFNYLLKHPKEEIRIIMNARKAAKSWPTHIQKIESLVAQAKARNGKLGVPLHYYGGHTGRWSGAEGINLQNLGGRGRGEAIHPLISRVRNMLRAPKGYVLLIADYAQIEARVLAWFAGQQDLLDDFTAKKDIYSKFATTLYNSPVRKPKESDPLPIYTFLKIRRGFGKDAILGLGYGMGANKFYERCQENSSLKDKFEFDFIQKAVNTYRTKFNRIPAWWRELETQIKWIIKYPHAPMKESGRLKFHSDLSHNVEIELPNGRVLFYPHCRLSDNTISYQYDALWGGSLAENIVQATSRDILAEAILRLEECDLHVIMHAHDEAIAVCPETDCEDVLAAMVENMREVPVWATGLPIDVEGSVSEYYKI